MSEEESFVILGSCSPKTSLSIGDCLQNGFESLEISQIEKDSAANNDDDDVVDKATEAIVENTKQNDTTLVDTEANDAENLSQSTPATPVNINLESLEEKQEESVCVTTQTITKAAPMEQRSLESNKSVEMQNSTKSLTRSSGSGSGSANGSLAASFIMGEVNADVLKTSVYSQFPSLCSMEACADDVLKLQTFMSEYIELKSTLAKVNATMRQFYEKTQQWRDEMQKNEQHYKKQLESFHHQIAMLRNENIELKQEMHARMQQMQLSDDLKRKEFAEILQLVSEKSALVDNLRDQIHRLESQNLTSYEYIPRNENDTKQAPDYIARSEHLLAIKEMERKLSALLAENLELKDLQQTYIDEINCLKVNLTSAEELLLQSRRDIDFLKEKDLEKSSRFTEYETERDKMREEILLLRQQCDVFGKDFQMERSARENLAGEKDQLIQDLRNMQRTNQKLIEEQKLYLESVVNLSNNSTNTASGTSSQSSESSDANSVLNQVSHQRFIAKSPTPASFASNQHQRPIRELPQASSSKNSFHCPVCGVGYESLSVLQSHVNSCLDNS